MSRRNPDPFPSRPREWFFAGVGIGVIWALFTNPAGLGCLLLLLGVGAALLVMILAVVAVQYWWVALGGAALFAAWLYVRYRETRMGK